METYKFTLRGITPLLMHAEDSRYANVESMQKSRDDRFPAWTWQMHVSRYGNRVAMPIDNVMACLHKAESHVISANKRGKTFKLESPSTILIRGMKVDGVSSAYLRFSIGDKEIAFDKIDALRHKPFMEQLESVREFGFDLHVKHTTVDALKHVRVRPIFSNWTLSGIVKIVSPEQMSFEFLQELFDVAGRRVGVGEWHSGSPKSSKRYGKFKCSWVKEKTALEELEDQIEEVQDEIRELNAVENLPMHSAAHKLHLEIRLTQLQRTLKRENNPALLAAQRQSQTCPNPSPALFRMGDDRSNSSK